MKKDVVYIGMDLGTFKTSVASSLGVRDVVLSSVGWPKDHVARTMLGRDVIFGNDIVEHRLALHVVRPFEKGVLKFNSLAAAGVAKETLEKHKEAARLLVEHAVSLTHPPKGLPVYGVIGAPSRASVLNKQVVLEAAYGPPWRPDYADEVAAMRERLEASRPALDLKRGTGRHGEEEDAQHVVGGVAADPGSEDRRGARDQRESE